MAFWIACGLAALGGLAPLVLGGISNRTAGAAIPFGVAAVAMALNALIHHQGRTVPTLLYFLAGIAIVYAMLWMIAIPLQLAVLGACPPPPDPCPAGQQPSLTSGESDGIAAGITMGMLAIGAGFVGLAILYRRKPKFKFTPTTPAVRTRPPMESKASVSEPEPEPAAVAPAAAAEHEAPGEPEAIADVPPPQLELSAPEPTLELSAPEPTLELSAPEPTLELPAPEPEPIPPAAMTPASAPGPKPRARRARRPEPPAAPGSEPPADDLPSS